MCMSKSFLIKAVEILGGQVATAKSLGVAQAHVWAWINKTKDGIPAKNVIAVSKATEWIVTPHQLRPDLYPHPMDGLPDHLRLGATFQDLPPAHGPECCARQTTLST